MQMQGVKVKIGGRTTGVKCSCLNSTLKSSHKAFTSLLLLQDMASVYTGLMQGVGGAEKVFEYMDREPRHPADGAEAPETCSGLVEFKDVTFAYPSRPNADILKVGAGEPPRSGRRPTRVTSGSL